jgi:drug/metabolite transporter (DMT)-like permease
MITSPSLAPPRRTMTAIGYMVASSSLFGLMAFFGRLATASAPWTSVACIRSVVGATIALVVARARGASLAPNSWSALFWRSFFGTLSMMGTFYALSSHTLSLGNTVTLLHLGPLFLAVLAPIFLGERTHAAVGFGVVLGLTGVVLIARPAFLFGHAPDQLVSLATSAAGPSTSATVMAAVCGALATSFAMMMLRRAGQTESPETIAFHFSLFASFVTGALWLVDLRLPSSRDAVFMVVAGVCAGVGQLLMTRAYAMEQAARIGGLSYFTPVFSTILAAAILGEHPRPLALAGMAIVVTGGIVVTFVRPATVR